jgi:hypothetical protein
VKEQMVSLSPISKASEQKPEKWGYHYWRPLEDQMTCMKIPVIPGDLS